MAVAKARMVPPASNFCDDGATATPERMKQQTREQQRWLETEQLHQYAMRGSEDEWAVAPPGGKSARLPSTATVKTEMRTDDKRPSKKHVGVAAAGERKAKCMKY